MESFHEEKTAGLLCIIVPYLHAISLSFLVHLLTKNNLLLGVWLRLIYFSFPLLGSVVAPWAI